MSYEIFIPILTSVITGLLSYLAAIKKSKSDLESSKIQANNEIEKIRESADAEIKKVKETSEVENARLKEQYYHDLEKMKMETDEQIRIMIMKKELENKSKSDEMANQFASQAFNNPQEMIQNLNGMSEVMGGLVGLQKEMEKLGLTKKE